MKGGQRSFVAVVSPKSRRRHSSREAHRIEAAVGRADPAEAREVRGHCAGSRSDVEHSQPRTQQARGERQVGLRALHTRAGVVEPRLTLRRGEELKVVELATIPPTKDPK